MKSAEAAQYVFGESWNQARYMFRYNVLLCPNATYIFETRNTTSGGDPVMYLLKGSTEVAYSDDTFLGWNGSVWVLSDESKITYTVPSGPSCAWHTVLVRAYSNNTGGNGGKSFDFYLSNFLVGRYPVAGFQINTNDIVGAQETMETVLVNDGAPATLLYAFDYNGNHHAFRAMDQTSGVGAASKLPGSNVADKTHQIWVVGTAVSTTREGKVRVVRNDVALRDADGDGLGDYLEAQGTATCPYAAHTTATGFNCATARTTRDTDDDGLVDVWEAVGEDHATLPLLFPLWGASPIHKDVFVEMDTYAQVTTNDLFQWPQANLVAARYADLGQQNNPDRLPGIRPHFDIGFACNDEPGDVDGISATCGMFGGASTVPVGQACSQSVPCPGGQVCTPFGTCSPGCGTDGGNMAANRRWRFHWGIRNNGAQG
ncbi:MAG: hypothetical protein AAB131_02130, partial [Actinomycetota bacterium]